MESKRRSGKTTRVDGEQPVSIGNAGWKGLKYYAPRDFTCKCDGQCSRANVISLELAEKLDRIQGLIAMPVKIISGTRCFRHDLKCGDSGKSPHVEKNGTSHAADIFCPSAIFRHAFLKEAIRSFRRIGLGKDFIHVDTDPSMPQDVLWISSPSNFYENPGAGNA